MCFHTLDLYYVLHTAVLVSCCVCVCVWSTGEWSWIWGMLGGSVWRINWCSEPPKSSVTGQSDQGAWAQTHGKHLLTSATYFKATMHLLIGNLCSWWSLINNISEDIHQFKGYNVLVRCCVIMCWNYYATCILFLCDVLFCHVLWVMFWVCRAFCSGCVEHCGPDVHDLIRLQNVHPMRLTVIFNLLRL